MRHNVVIHRQSISCRVRPSLEAKNAAGCCHKPNIVLDSIQQAIQRMDLCSQARAAKLDVAAATMTMDKLVVMTAEIVSHFKLQNMIGLGVGGGAWVLAAYAARYPQVIAPLFLASSLFPFPSCCYIRLARACTQAYTWGAKTACLMPAAFRVTCQHQTNSGWFCRCCLIPSR